MHINTSDVSIQRPWYCEPMVWIVIVIPLSAVIVGVLMFTLAIRSYDGLVVDDYYKHGKEINRVLTRNENALSHKLLAGVRLGAGNSLVVDLQHEKGFVAPQQLEIRFLHRTRSGYDQSVILDRYADGIYRGTLLNTIKGIWHVQLETAEWRITGTVSLPGVDYFLLDSQ